MNLWGRRCVTCCALLWVGWLWSLMMAGCGGGGGATAPPLDYIPFDGARRYQLTEASEGELLMKAAIWVQIADLAPGRAVLPGEVRVFLTTNDGWFTAAPVTITRLEDRFIVGVVQDSEGLTYDIEITIHGQGERITLKLTERESSQSLTSTSVSVDILPPDAEADPTLLAAATAKLSALITAGAHRQPVTLAQLTDARQAYAAALVTGAEDPRANFGWALLNLAVVVRESAEQIGVDPDDLDDLFAAGGGSGDGAFGPARLFPLWAGRALYNPGSLIETVAASPGLATETTLSPAAAVLSPGAASRGRVIYQTDSGPFDDALIESELRGDVLNAIVAAAQGLRITVDAASFAYTVSFTDENDDPYDLAFGHAEALLVAGAVDLIEAGARLALVYRVAGTDMDVDPVTEAELADGTLTPVEYCFPAPWGTLTGDGRSQGQNAILAFQRATGRVKAAWASINAQNTIAGQNLDDLNLNLGGGGSDSIGGGRQYRALSAQDRQDVTKALDEIDKLFAGRYTIDWDYLDSLGDDEPTSAAVRNTFRSVNVPAFWNNPPADLRSVLPTFGRVVQNQPGPTTDLLVYGVGTFNGQRRGSWPAAGGNVGLGGLLDPAVPEATLVNTVALALTLRQYPWTSPGYEYDLDVTEGDGSARLPWDASLDYLPWTGERTFAFTTGSGINATIVIGDNEAAARATSYQHVTVRLTTSNGWFNNTAGTVAWVANNHVRFTAIDTLGNNWSYCSVWLTDAGTQVTVELWSSTGAFLSGTGSQAR